MNSSCSHSCLSISKPSSKGSLLHLFFILAVSLPASLQARHLFPENPVIIPDTIQQKIRNTRTSDDINALLDDAKKLVYNVPDVAAALSRNIIQLSLKKKFPGGVFKANNIIGVYHQNQGNFDSAAYYFAQASRVAQEAGNKKFQAEVFNNFGVLNRRKGLYDSAYHYYEKALALAYELTDSLLIGMYHNNLGLVCQNTERYQESVEHHLKALAVREKLGDKANISASYNNLGIVYSEIGEYELSLNYHNKSLAIRKALGNKRQLAMGYLNIGEVYYHTKQYEKALEVHEAGLRLAKELNDRQIMASIYDNLSYIMDKFGSRDVALKYALEGLEISRQIDDRQGMIKGNTKISKILMDLNRNGEAMQHGKLAYEMAAEEGGLNAKMTSAQLLAALYEKAGDYQNSLKYFMVYMDKKDSLDRERYDKDIADVRERYETDKKEETIKLQQSELERQTLLAEQNSTQRNFLIAAVSLIAVILILSITIYNTRLRAKELVNRKNQELESMRSQFFANISHEFRTPLTLILGPVKHMLETRKLDEESLRIVMRNAGRLERLISQLLDLSRFEAGKMQVDKKTSDFYSFIRAVTSSFRSAAARKNIRFEQFIPEDPLPATFDHDKVEKIIYNLLSNAFKFTPEDGLVTIAVKPQHDNIYCLEISDTGKGIPASEFDHIFERFNRSWAEGKYQYEGSGIGLALTKEMVDILGGEIKVTSKPEEGAVFNVSIPLEAAEQITADEGAEITESPEPDDVLHHSEEETADIISGPVVLLVEDNADLRQYIRLCFTEQYRVIEAENGKQGFDRCLEEMPDLVISDLMMPELDGIELCKKIRAHEATAHIPFIMLTARADDKSKLTGLGLGADDYIVKPFNVEELAIKVKNNIEHRKVLHERLRRQMLLEPQPLDVLSADESFLFKLKELIERKMSEPELSVESLSREVALSRVQLYRKVLSLTGVSVNELIRSIRLKKASQLIDRKWGTVSQVAYEVGFNNLSYFAKCFKSEFGKTPSEYMTQVKRK